MLKKYSEWCRVTVVLVNYNNNETLEDCIESLLCRTAEDIEILVVDNGSRDGSMEYIEKHYPQLHTEYMESNMGFGKGCNRGMEIAFDNGSQFVLLLNTDTEIEEGMISELLKYCDDNTLVIPRIYKDKENKENSLWYSGGKINYETGEVEQTLFKYDVTDDECNLPRKVEFATGCCMMISKAVWEKAGGFAEEYFLYYEDVDYCIRLKECGIDILYVPQAALWHKVGGSAGGEISAVSLYYTIRNRLYFVNKYKQYMKCDFEEIMKSIMGYFILPFNQKYNVIMLRAITDYFKGVYGKEENYICDNYTVLEGFYDVEGKEGNLWRWCGSPDAKIELYNPYGGNKTREMLLFFTIKPAPLKTDVHLKIIDDNSGIINEFDKGTHHLKIQLKPYEKRVLRFCTDDIPVTGFNGDTRNLFYQIMNIRIEDITMSKEALEKFCSDFKCVYMYGTGKKADQLINFYPNVINLVDGFVETTPEHPEASFFGKKILSAKSVIQEGTGFLLVVAEKTAGEVFDYLLRNGVVSSQILVLSSLSEFMRLD